MSSLGGDLFAQITMPSPCAGFHPVLRVAGEAVVTNAAKLSLVKDGDLPLDSDNPACQGKK